LQIRARPVAAHVHVDLALVLVHALPSRRVQNVSGRTLAPVRPVRVYALAAVTRVGHEIALVQVFALVAAAHALGTQFGERVCDRHARIFIFPETTIVENLPLPGLGQAAQSFPQPPPVEQQHSFSVILCFLGAKQLPANTTVIVAR